MIETVLLSINNLEGDETIQQPKQKYHIERNDYLLVGKMRTAKIKEKYHIEYHRFIIFEKTPRKPTQNVQSWIINGAVSMS